MTENNYACKDGLWRQCGAPGDALRRASEAERKVEELERQEVYVGACNADGSSKAADIPSGYLDEDEG